MTYKYNNSNVDEIVKTGEASTSISGSALRISHSSNDEGHCQIRALKKNVTIDSVDYVGSTEGNAVVRLEACFDSEDGRLTENNETLFNHWAVVDEVSINVNRTGIFMFNVHEDARYRIKSVSGPAIHVWMG